MAGTIKISTAQVEGIASSIETQNNKLNDTLQTSRSTMQSLGSIWTGEASSAALNAYNSFAETYFQSYYDIVKSYVTFLRQNVVSDYSSTETSNISLAEAFK